MPAESSAKSKPARETAIPDTLLGEYVSCPAITHVIPVPGVVGYMYHVPLFPANGATRYVNPTTGRSVVIDNVTQEVLHVGGDGFLY
jgi:hypothetical protein